MDGFPPIPQLTVTELRELAGQLAIAIGRLVANFRLVAGPPTTKGKTLSEPTLRDANNCALIAGKMIVAAQMDDSVRRLVEGEDRFEEHQAELARLNQFRRENGFLETRDCEYEGTPPFIAALPLDAKVRPFYELAHEVLNSFLQYRVMLEGKAPWRERLGTAKAKLEMLAKTGLIVGASDGDADTRTLASAVTPRRHAGTPLSDRESAVFDLLKSLAPGKAMTGEKIVAALSKAKPPLHISTSDLTRNIIPRLKSIGVRNRPRVGYFIDSANG